MKKQIVAKKTTNNVSERYTKGNVNVTRNSGDFDYTSITKDSGIGILTLQPKEWADLVEIVKLIGGE